MLAAPSLHAQAIEPTTWFVQLGTVAETHSLVAGVTRDWDSKWRLVPLLVGGYWEAALGRWRTTGLPGHDTVWVTQFGITPVLRLRPGEGASPWFFEAGIGLNVLTPTYRRADKSFSTRLNFGDHLAVGRSLGAGGRHELALRIEHFSDGGVRRPNPGENFVQLRYAIRF